MNVTIYRPRLNLRDLKSYRPATMNASTQGEYTTAEAREFAARLIAAADEIDAINERVAAGTYAEAQP